MLARQAGDDQERTVRDVLAAAVERMDADDCRATAGVSVGRLWGFLA